MTPRTIRADGVDWPLATFIDAYGLKPVAGTPGANLCKVCDEPVFEGGLEDDPNLCANCEAWGGDAW